MVAVTALRARRCCRSSLRSARAARASCQRDRPMVAMRADRRGSAARRKVPEVDRVAVRIVTDNMVIQFVPNEKRDDLTIERRTGGNTTPDAPPRTALHGEWGLSMHAESQRGERDAQRAGRFRLHAGGAHQQHGDPQNRSVDLRRDRAEPRPLRPFRRHGRLPQARTRASSSQAAILRRRRGLRSASARIRAAIRRARPQGDHGRRPRADDGGGARRSSPIMPSPPAGSARSRSRSRCGRPRRSSASSTASAASRRRCRRRRTSAPTFRTISTTRSATVYMVKGKGLVVLTSCSHRGVINTVRQAQKASGIDKVHAVIGGFHIVPPLGRRLHPPDHRGLQGDRSGLSDPGALHRRPVLRPRPRRDGRQGDPLGGRNSVRLRRGRSRRLDSLVTLFVFFCLALAAPLGGARPCYAPSRPALSQPVWPAAPRAAVPGISRICSRVGVMTFIK